MRTSHFISILTGGVVIAVGTWLWARGDSGAPARGPLPSTVIPTRAESPSPVEKVERSQTHAPDGGCLKAPAHLVMLTSLATSSTGGGMAMVYDTRWMLPWMVSPGSPLSRGVVEEISVSGLTVKRPNGERVCVSKGERLQVAPPPSRPQAPRVSRRPVRRRLSAVTPRAIAPGVWGVPGDAVEAWMADPNLLGVRMRPVQGAEGLEGFRLSARPRSIARKIGLQSGDVLHQVGDQPLTSLTAALTALEDHKTAERVVLTVMRRGRPVKVELRREGPSR